MIGQGQRVPGGGSAHPLHELAKRAEEVVDLLRAGRRLALGLDDEPLRAPPSVEIDASVPTPTNVHRPAVRLQGQGDGALHRVLGIRSLTSTGVWGGISAGRCR